MGRLTRRPLSRSGKALRFSPMREGQLSRSVDGRVLGPVFGIGSLVRGERP